MLDKITGVILAGGRSTRMGKNKALLPYLGKNLIDAPIEKLNEIFANVVLSVKKENDFSRYSLLKIVDQYSEIGPIGGITSALKSGIQRAFVVACDMPFLNPALIKYLCEISDADAVIPVWAGRAEVLHSIYSASLLDHLETAISAGHYRITDALRQAHVSFVDEEQIRQMDPTGQSFRNVNTPPDYEMI